MGRNRFIDHVINNGIHEDAVIATVLDGSACGMKAVFLGGNVLYKDEGFPEDIEIPDPRSRGCCADTVSGSRIFAESGGRKRRAVICGGGHVAQEVLIILKRLGYWTTLIEDRGSFAAEAEKNGADDVRVGDFSEILEGICPDPGAAFVVMTRGHRYDLECLDVILKGDFAYAGMMSSKRRMIPVREELLKRGISEEKLSALHAPIGLKIGAVTPPEIAVSTAAEIIEAMSHRVRRAYDDEILEALKGDDDKVLVEVVTKRGPAPREPGTKMVVKRNGETAGTVGGGCMEAEMIRKALLMMQLGERAALVTADLTADLPDEEDIACGGRIEALLTRM